MKKEGTLFRVVRDGYIPLGDGTKKEMFKIVLGNGDYKAGDKVRVIKEESSNG